MDKPIIGMREKLENLRREREGEVERIREDSRDLVQEIIDDRDQMRRVLAEDAQALARALEVIRPELAEAVIQLQNDHRESREERFAKLREEIMETMAAVSSEVNRVQKQTRGAQAYGFVDGSWHLHGSQAAEQTVAASPPEVAKAKAPKRKRSRKRSDADFLDAESTS
ncbi:MAG: hypothetical protein AAGE01_10255 [Pseudomonadota bacterium]